MRSKIENQVEKELIIILYVLSIILYVHCNTAAWAITVSIIDQVFNACIPQCQYFNHVSECFF